MSTATFSDRLKTTLKKKGISQTELAKRTGMTKQAINQYVSGVINPRMNKVKLFADVLNVNVSYLMGLNVSEDGTPITSFNDVIHQNNDVYYWNKAVALAFKELREKNNINIPELSEMLGWSVKDLIAFENLEEPIPTATTFRLCYKLKYSRDQFSKDVDYHYRKLKKESE